MKISMSQTQPALSAPYHLTQSPDHELLVTGDQPVDRLDRYLAAQLPQYSRARIQQWIAQGAVLIDQQPARVRSRPQPGARIQLWIPLQPEEQADEPQNLPLDILYESPQVIVLNKAAGMVTHPGAGNWSGTLQNALLYHFPELAQLERAGIVHRLDKDTSGLLMVARTSAAQQHLQAQLKGRTVLRAYRALCQGWPPAEGVIDSPIGRDKRVPVRMRAGTQLGARAARTDFSRLRCGELGPNQKVAELQCRLHTGRTHQIRVHLSSIGHPIVGDGLYQGWSPAGAGRQMLHAHMLGFVEPGSGEDRLFECSPPDDYQQLCAQIQFHDDTD